VSFVFQAVAFDSPPDPRVRKKMPQRLGECLTAGARCGQYCPELRGSARDGVGGDPVEARRSREVDA
jgi:hypothetical protein